MIKNGLKKKLLILSVKFSINNDTFCLDVPT